MSKDKNTQTMDLYKRYNIPENEKREMKMKRRLIKVMSITCAAIVLLTILLFSSCEKKELCYLPHPHDSKICHTEITLNFNTAWDGDLIDSYTRATTESYPMRYVLEFWEVDDEGTLLRLIDRKEVKGKAAVEGENKQVIPVDLPAFKMAVLCWAEPLPQTDKGSNPNFDATDLRRVRLVEPYGTTGKDAFTASATWDYTVHQYEQNGISLRESIRLNRPFGNYTMISNDIKEYRKEAPEAPLPTSVKVDYQLFIPNTFDVFHQIPSNPISGANYLYSVTKWDEDEIHLANDYIFVGTSDTGDNSYNIVLNSYDGTTLIKRTGSIGFRIQRNKHTLIYGAFLTDRKTNSPGIDDGFDDNEDIIIDDNGNIIVKPKDK